MAVGRVVELCVGPSVLNQRGGLINAGGGMYVPGLPGECLPAELQAMTEDPKGPVLRI